LFAKAIAIGESEIKPRNFIFDKPYYIILKHKNQEHPYFVMKVNNAELMEK